MKVKLYKKMAYILCFLLVFNIILLYKDTMISYASNSAHEESFTDDFDTKDNTVWKWNNGWGINFNHSSKLDIAYCNGYPFKNGYLELKHNFKTFNHYVMSVDLVHGGNLDGDTIDGGVYFDKQGWNNAEYFYFQDLPRNKAPYHIEVEAIKNSDNSFNIECILKDKNNTTIETKNINNYDLKWFGLYGPEGYWDGLSTIIRVSSFDNFTFNGFGGIESDYEPYDFDVIQEGDKIKFTWNMANKNSNNKFHIYYSDDENVDNNDVRMISNQKVDLVDGKYVYTIDFNDEYNEKYFGVSYRINGKDESKIASDSQALLLVSKPENFQYIDYGNGQIEFMWEEVQNAEYYILYNDGEEIEESQTSETSIVLSDIDDMDNISLRAFSIDGGYSEATTDPEALAVDLITNFKVVQDRDQYNLSWDAFTGAIGYRIYSGTNPNEMVEIYSTDGDTNFQYDISNEDYGNTRYFKVEALGQSGTTAISTVLSISPIAAPIVSFPDSSNVEFGDELLYVVNVIKLNGSESLVVELNEYIELVKAYVKNDPNQELDFTRTDNIYTIDISDLQDGEQVEFVVKAMPNLTEDIITTNFIIYYIYIYENNENASDIVTVPDIILQPTTVAPIVDLGVLESDGETVIIPGEEQSKIEINYGKDLGVKTIIDVNAEDLYNPILKYELIDTPLFKYKFPEPIVKGSNGNSINYEASYTRENNKLIVYVKPILGQEDNKLNNNSKYEIELSTNIVPRDNDSIKALMNSLEEPIWKLPYEIRNITNNPEALDNIRTIISQYNSDIYNNIKDLTNDELREVLINLNIKMQLLWNAEPISDEGFERQFRLPNEKNINFELQDMQRLPGSF